MAAAKSALDINRKAALGMAERAGAGETRRLLVEAQKDLERRLREAEGLGGPGKDSFTASQLRSMLAQVKQVTRDLNVGLQGNLTSSARQAAEQATEDTVSYLTDAEKKFRGTAAQPLGLNQATLVNRAVSGSEASLLRRIAEGPEGTKGKQGILARYGGNVLDHFERVLSVGLATKKSMAEMRDEITRKSPFLQGAPAHWAERIVRTETMAAYNKGAHIALVESDEQLGDMVKIIVAHFDPRTASDSYATHGQIRRPKEPFDTWYGQMMHPPDRPNDRGTTVPHRVSWPIPKNLAWKSDGEILARWRAEKRKGSPPPRPKMTTVPLSEFGKKPKKKPDPRGR